MAVDGQETWNIQNYSYPGETGLDHLDRDWVIRSILGVGPDFDYEVLSCENWIARRLVASKFRDRRVFICGDAAHVWMPLGGFGMSAGIADAANLAWKLAGVLHGWARPQILDAYEAERQPITNQASRIISDIGYQIMMQRNELSTEVERLDAVGQAVVHRMSGSKGGAPSTTRSGRIIRYCASTPRRTSTASWQRPRNAACRLPFST